MNPLVLRIVFKSGRVAEERGDEMSVTALFAQDEMGLIDHIMMIDLVDGEVAIFAEENDMRYNDLEVLFSDDLIRRAT